jgi:hypothetical protein
VSPGPNHRPQHILAIVIIGLFLVGGAIFVLSKLGVWYAISTAFNQQKDEQKAATPKQYQLASTPVTLSTSPAVSIKLPDGWDITKTPSTSSVTAIGPADYTSGKTEPQIEALVSQQHYGSITDEVTQFKLSHSVPTQLLSQNSSTSGATQIVKLEYKTAVTLGVKAGQTPPYEHSLAQIVLKNGYYYETLMKADERDFSSLSGLFDQSLQSFTY